MVTNFYYKCKVCGTKFRLRTQIGNSNIKVNFYCPECNSKISGFIDCSNGKIKREFENLIPSEQEINCFKIELSSEFLTKKFIKDDDSIDVSPFIRNVEFNDNIIKYKTSLINLIENIKKYVTDFDTLFSFLKNPQTKIEYIKKFIFGTSNDFFEITKNQFNIEVIKNKLDVNMFLKYCIAPFVWKFIPPSKMRLNNKIGEKIEKLLKNNRNYFCEFIKYLDENGILNNYYKIGDFFLKFFKKIYQLIPIYLNYHKLDKINQNIFGITTMSIDDLYNLYSEGYELFCNLIVILFGFNNLLSNRRFDDFGNGHEDYNDKIKSYGGKYNRYLECLKIDSLFQDGFIDELNNTIRNSIAHNDFEIEGLKQIIHFKDNKKDTSLTFIDFGKKIIDLYCSIVIMWEYYYQLIKIKLVNDGNFPNLASIKV